MFHFLNFSMVVVTMMDLISKYGLIHSGRKNSHFLIAETFLIFCFISSFQNNKFFAQNYQIIQKFLIILIFICDVNFILLKKTFK